jgi:hypothetical protein
VIGECSDARSSGASVRPARQIVCEKRLWSPGTFLGVTHCVPSKHFTSGYTMAKRQHALHSKVNKTSRGNASVQGGRGKATKPKVRYSKRSVASTTMRGQRSPRAAARNSAHNNEVLANSHTDATLPATLAPQVIGSAARLESPPKSISILGVFYDLSRARMALAQISAQKLQRGFVALIGCRSPQEFFQLQNQLLKEQAELLAASIYAPFLNHVVHSSDQVKAAL